MVIHIESSLRVSRREQEKRRGAERKRRDFERDRGSSQGPRQCRLMTAWDEARETPCYDFHYVILLYVYLVLAADLAD